MLEISGTTGNELSAEIPEGSEAARKRAMLSPYALPLSQQQEEFSRAYIAAVASAAGYSAERRQVDMDCIDVDIRQRGNGTDVPWIDCLSVQAKCTFALSPAAGYLSYQLDAATFNSLCQPRSCPRILVIVHVPRTVTEWLTHDTDCTILRHNAYWLSLVGQMPIHNAGSRAVRVPTSQQFTVEWLQETMNRLATQPATGGAL